MGLKKTYLILILFCIALVSNAQPKEGNIWCFGTNAGLDFNSGSPLSFTSSISTGEGCASISNEHGNLLFYTDGSSIYNKNHVLMNNGAGLFGSSTSTQSGIIVPNPSGSSIYYVFSTSGIGSLMYSIVDTSLSGGLGYVTSKNNSLMPSGCEKLNGVGHSNGRDTWVVSHQRNNNNFYAYLVTSSGVDTSAVISSVGSTFSGIALGYLKFSPDGKKIVTAQYFGGNDAVEIFDFDTKTGKVSNAQTLKSTGTKYYGVEFSASGRYLYIAKTDISPSVLLQYDMKAGNISAIRNSEITIANSFLKAPGALQLGPDEKIYIAFVGAAYLGVINKPENKDTACNFVENGVTLSSGSSVWGLPSFNQSFFYRPSADIEYEDFECGSLSTVINNIGDTANIISSKWDFGDGTEDTGLIVNKTYLKHGTYTLTNIVNILAEDSLIIDTLIESIKTRPIPKASFWINDSSQCYNDNLFEFKDSSGYFFGSKYKGNKWSLGDNNPDISNRNSGQKRYSKTGTYNVKLIVESDDGCFDTLTRQIIVKPSPTSWFSIINHKQCFGDNMFSFIQSSSIDTPAVLSHYKWDFGDNTNSINAKPIKKYTDTGSYTIKLEVIGSNNCKSSSNDVVRVLPNPAANFTAPNVCHQDTTIFLNQSTTQTTSPLNYTWHFGNGVTSSTIHPKYHYKDSGQYTIKLIATNTHNCKDSISKTTRIYPKPQANFQVEGNCIQHTIEFTDNTQRYGSSAQTNTWNLDDGKSSNNISTVITAYTTHGNKTIHLQVEDQNGCKDSITKQHYINPLPIVDFTINKSQQCIKGNNFSISEASTIPEGNISQYTWSINGTVESQTQNLPNQTFSQTGNHTIKLITQSDSGCIDSANKNITVYPNINLDITINKTAQCFNQQQFITTNNSTVNGAGNITQYNWIYSDNTTETTKTPQPKEFSKDGDYTLTAILETDKGCKDTLTKTLTVYYSPTPNFETEDICYGDSAYFDNTTPNKDSITNWHWDFGDGTTAATENPYRKYPATGNYQIQLIATTNNNCRDTIENYYPNLVKPQPKAHYQDTLIDSYDRYTTIQFNNQSTDGTDYLWDFGDGTIENTEHPEKVYNEIGQFTVTLTVNNQWNCEDIYKKQIYVVPTSYINIPTAFTPGNRDELNKYFRVEGIYYTKEIDMKIFNRWGTLIYHSNKTAPKWDGRYKGELVPDGVYLYAIRILDYKNKVHIYNGSVTVIK